VAVRSDVSRGRTSVTFDVSFRVATLASNVPCRAARVLERIKERVTA
jgi:hypothetical protein